MTRASDGLGDRHGLVVSAGTISGGECELGAGGDGVAGSGVGPGVQDQDDGVVEGASPGVAFAEGVPLGAAVVLAVAAQTAEGGGVAAGVWGGEAARGRAVGALSRAGAPAGRGGRGRLPTRSRAPARG